MQPPTDENADAAPADELRAEGPVEAEFERGIAGRMPRKRVAAGVLVRDADDETRVLLVEPTYKPRWDIPGGVVEADEPPLDACRREIREELGLDLPVHRLLAVDWLPRRGPWHDGIAFVFDGGTLPAGRLADVVLPADELRAVRFVTLAEAAGHLSPSALRRFGAALDVATDAAAGPAYLEFGHRVLP